MASTRTTTTMITTSKKMLGNFFDNGLYSDVSLRCGKDVIACHRVVLAHRSAYFEALFRHRPGPGRCLDLAPVFAGDRGLFRLVLAFMYGRAERAVTNRNVARLLGAANYLLYPALIRACLRHLLTRLTTRNCLSAWMAVGRLGPGRYEESERVFRSLAVSRLCDHPRLPGASLAVSRLNPEELLWCLDRGLTECADRADARSLVRRYATGRPGPVEQLGPIMRSALSHCRGRSVAGPGGLLVDTALVLQMGNVGVSGSGPLCLLCRKGRWRRLQNEADRPGAPDFGFRYRRRNWLLRVAQDRSVVVLSSEPPTPPPHPLWRAVGRARCRGWPLYRAESDIVLLHAETRCSGGALIYVGCRSKMTVLFFHGTGPSGWRVRTVTETPLLLPPPDLRTHASIHFTTSFTSLGRFAFMLGDTLYGYRRGAGWETSAVPCRAPRTAGCVHVLLSASGLVGHLSADRITGLWMLKCGDEGGVVLPVPCYARARLMGVRSRLAESIAGAERAPKTDAVWVCGAGFNALRLGSAELAALLNRDCSRDAPSGRRPF